MLINGTFSEMSTVPVISMTFLYVLKNRAQQKADESLLIHSGAGGVGVAVIQMAKDIGATTILFTQ